ncbi:hypothetical protein PNQ29_10000 [Halobacterium salinarum]|uniref:hypothetical protein n=1 Tax=Halobacterium salinarum TaxID=2242 RepID=UPI000A71395D|nr:hypothetical protein [Halobacterium salinarum]MCF2206061.1 hypothetical protein [Halobacterium salinarum]MCF2239951.1 hypothetical protein [Halobacterium salinarum]MDL0120056.1 hypothetical protein [Halobacterium salinarum]MDL0128901.1 hypothetical protein [Halobacterium salinarum]MDL0145195.1 hypothetical protein [Halobacterium salinarum]
MTDEEFDELHEEMDEQRDQLHEDLAENLGGDSDDYDVRRDVDGSSSSGEAVTHGGE